ncbi:hypothetical protein NOI83_22935 [Escherichia coli]|uniref:hypothetical protein n=1 Tax=Escherichia coli TaxID=562 RepID=UPI0002AA7903|nr:hypothetical protein [Escherichia coli]EFA4228218.1 hypothetical protein [Escherichia coli O11:H15]EEY8845519.1 hypothetical protein [Escherichia coli]EFA5048609.1 hypothetical protein [Escherichia coli]EFC6959720.1 hypothetical protein [Escherichia coli]EFD5343190.1 hypothetical protein [Escherichia coli]
MATQDYKSKMLHYRHAIMLPKKDALLTSNLQDRLANLVKIKVPNVADRLFFPDVPDNNGNVAAHAHMVLSNSKEIHGMFFAEIVYIEPGSSIPVFSVSDYAKTALTYETLNLSSGNAREYLESIAYIGVIKNHFIILQSRSIRIKDIENYINFILQDNLSITDDNFIVLQANNLSLNTDFLKRNIVKNVSLKLPLTYYGNNIDDTASELLKTLVGEHRINEMKKNTILNDGSPDRESLSIDISIGYKYKASESEQDMLRKITQGLVDNRDESLTIELKGAGILRNDEIQLKDSVNIEYSNGMLIADNVAEEMISWLLRLLDTGVINP